MMFRHARRALLACAATAAALAAPGVAQADVLNDWNVIAQDHAITLRPTAHGQTRGIAMVQGAVYDAVNAIDRGYQPYLLDVDDVRGQPWASQDAAIATAAHDVLVEIVAPAQVAGARRRLHDNARRNPGWADRGRRAFASGGPLQQRCSTPAEDDGFLAPFTFVIGLGRGRLEAADADRARSGRVGRQPQAVPDREPVAVPLEGTERARRAAGTRRTSTR